MQSLEILAIAALVIALILAIVIWTIVFIEYRRLKKAKRVEWLIDRIRERAEDSGNESDGDTEELSALIELGNYDLGANNNL
uniref:Protein Vpu n=1 Tax=Human immunodeficiency virus type 1 TaxID=11676 RepID=A0A0M3PN68_HV1|nr:vpu protein [Human immunodeficiency virus 1]